MSRDGIPIRKEIDASSDSYKQVCHNLVQAKRLATLPAALLVIVQLVMKFSIYSQNLKD